MDEVGRIAYIVDDDDGFRGTQFGFFGTVMASDARCFVQGTEFMDVSGALSGLVIWMWKCRPSGVDGVQAIARRRQHEPITWSPARLRSVAPPAGEDYATWSSKDRRYDQGHRDDQDGFATLIAAPPRAS